MDADTLDADTSATDDTEPKVEIGRIDKDSQIHAIVPNMVAKEAGSQLLVESPHRGASMEERFDAMQKQLHQSMARIQVLEDKFRKTVGLPKKQFPIPFNIYFQASYAAAVPE